jgi:hypothetical protein
MNLILTLDYELWGDGSGNVFHQIIEPTNRILNICDENKIKITIFFEAIEYLKLKDEWEKGNSMGYDKNPIKAIEAQLQNAALNGHDIQLHIHPQWVNAKYVNDKWEVDFSNWRLGDLRSILTILLKICSEMAKKHWSPSLHWLYLNINVML